MTPRLRDILTASLACRAVDVIGGPFDSDATWAAMGPDAVICEARDPLDVAEPDRLLRLAPRARVVMVAATGDQAVVYELQPERRVILNASASDIVDAIRA
jgi:hypothetical protein